MKFETGNICIFHYTNYHRDKNPLALILYADDKIVHCININYLTPSLTDDLINLIAKIIGRIIDGRDMYKVYHGVLKKKMPRIIQDAYRLYKSEYIHDVVFVSKGFQIDTLYHLKKKYDDEKIKKIESLIKKEIKQVKDKEPKEIASMNIPEAHLVKNIEDYFSKLKSIIKPTIDVKKFTGLRRKK